MTQPQESAVTNDQTAGDGAVDKTYTVKVQPNRETPTTDEYVVDGGYTPLVELVDEGELWITKTAEAEGEPVQSFVTTYARGTWVRCWIDEGEEE